MALTNVTATDTQAHELPEVADPSQVAPKDARELSKLFFDQLAVLEEGTPGYSYTRNTLIEMNMSLVRFAAGRFRSRGPEEMEDIVQVGMIGLIKAIDRFDLSRETEFTSFAIPYIVGEIKRFFRDTTWAVHVPRRLQEARVQLARATEELRSRLGRTPTVKELSLPRAFPGPAWSFPRPARSSPWPSRRQSWNTPPHIFWCRCRGKAHVPRLFHRKQDVVRE
ncbi:RNA polymerase sigma factor FliA [Streptomyces hirsutus]